ncbi:exporter of polyketide antibiotics [Lentzea sp. NBRC 105346]|uniref:ABC transporter permease n=1 Tax=Lentzea sp. NBRC 105346 TaxID=3032205 RepID=UPI0024A2ACBA|nr:ABC transporter permease [Lentzea sp. NBRC 105346]GLZ31579.1 exporter of polyketide antibiotics [Lentzea sp. NBRC 105346]
MIGTWNLVRLALRRDRIILPIWVLALVGITASTTTALEELYSSPESRKLLGITANSNAAFLSMLGPLHDSSTLGGLLAWRWGVFAALFAGIMSLLLVTRHTRAEEETGRLELISATVVGRHASLAAAIIVAAGANVLIGLLIAGLLLGKGLPAQGVLAFASSIVVTGLVFTGASALTAQLSENSRTANSMAGALLGAAYVVRGAGDSAGDNGPEWLTWVSPLGWAEQVRAFAGDRYWVFAIPLAVFVLTIAAAAVIVTKRDVGLALLPTRLGPARGASSLRSPFALAWRLQRGTLIGWTIGLFIVGVVYGSVAGAVGDMVRDNPALAKIVNEIGGEGGVTDAFIATVTQIMGLIGSVYLVQSTLRMRSEETSLRAEPVLATRVTRVGWVASHAVFPLVGGAVVLAAGGLGFGLLHGARENDLGGVVPKLIGASLAQLPAAWVVAGVALALFGLFPQLTGVSWAVLATSLLVTLLGPALQLDQWVLDIVPYTHIPKLPGASWTFEPFLWLTGVAVLLLAAGFIGFRRRDLTT